MKQAPGLLLILSIACIVLAGCSPPPQDDDTATYLWRLEKQYLGTLQAEDIEGLFRFWHPDFVGWPAHSPRPLETRAARESIEALLQETGIVSFEITPLMMKITGDVAIVHYTIDLVQEGEKDEKSVATLKITHTWLNTKSGWRIIGGMSADLPSFA